MPVSLLSLKIRGVRSYSPYEHKTQTVEFMPLTLIVGSNGSGKTTVIESLKFMISGEEPPLSDSRRNFLHTTQRPNESFDKKAAYSSIELVFQNMRNETCQAKREITKATTKTGTPSISSCYRVGKEPWVNVHKQDDWNKTLPLLFNLPNQALLNNVVLCHQEDNLWCMDDSSTVKQIFDKILGCEQYKKEIKHIENEIKACKSDLAISQRDADYNKENVERKKRLSGEISGLKAEIEGFEAKTKTLDKQIQENNKEKNLIMTNIKEIENSMRELDSLKQMAKLERELLQSKCDQAEIEDNLSSKQQKLVRSIKNLDGIYQSLSSKIKGRESTIERLNKQISSTGPDPVFKELTQVSENFSKMSLITEQMTETELVAKLNGLIEDSTRIIENLKLNFKDDSAVRFATEIERAKSDIEDVRNQLVSVDDQKKELAAQQIQTEAELEKARAASKEAHKRLSESNEKISTMQKSLKDESQLSSLQVKFREIEREGLNIRDKRSMIIGSKDRVDKELSRAEAELVSYRKCDSKYAESLGRVVCNNIVLSDLEKLKTCFQESITNFHDRMIVKINEVLRLRWRSIYRGSDIDSIELVDEEITRGKEKKGHNYYVAMRKSGLRMKMREKSSAGQKALASIILRMTLAELFVKDFAFIAFDEPTANLDLANVQSLAKAIVEYVRRRAQKGVNIQWIIITHDEKFLKALDAEYSPYYYKIQLDDEGCSKIVKISSQEHHSLPSSSTTD